LLTAKPRMAPRSAPLQSKFSLRHAYLS
jgi:hypothetical protein